jgi:hypothetical protein
METDVCRVILDADELEVWLGLVNSDDQGAAFDLRAELVIDSVLVAQGETLCVQGVTRNAAKAKSVAIDLDPTQAFGFLEGVVALTVFARIAAGCPGHASARGLRLYYGSAGRDSSFSLDVADGKVTPPPV